MAKTDNLTDFLTDLADGIRAKKGTTGKISPQNFRSEIDSLGGEAKYLIYSGDKTFSNQSITSTTQVVSADELASAGIDLSNYTSQSKLLIVTLLRSTSTTTKGVNYRMASNRYLARQASGYHYGYGANQNVSSTYTAGTYTQTVSMRSSVTQGIAIVDNGISVIDPNYPLNGTYRILVLAEI